MNRSMILLLLLAPAANAATFKVTRTDDPLPNGCDPHDCSLREAVLAANALAGQDTIALRSGSYNLTRIDSTPDTREFDRGALRVDESLLVDGASADRTLIRWNSVFKYYNAVFQTDSDVPVAVVLSLSDLAVSHGRGNQGGCVRMVNVLGGSAHHLALDDVRIEHCSAGSMGGAAYLHNTNLSLSNAELRENTAVYDGGALNLLGPVQIESSGSRIHHNLAQRHGGGVSIHGNGIAGVISNVTWTDDGSSALYANEAGGDGGAIHLWHTSTLDLSSLPGGSLMSLTRNSAAGRGGGVSLVQGLTQVSSTNQLERIRIAANSAASGGGLHSDVSVHVRDSEIAGNHATTGAGGGVLLTGSYEWPNGRSFERVSLNYNEAALGGGGISSECASVSLHDTALFGNQAAPADGQALQTLGGATLRHVTVYDNASGPALFKKYHTLCANQPIHYGNSLIDDACATSVPSQLVSDGGNQLGADATVCPDLPGVDERQLLPNAFALSIDDFAGPFDVPGWNNDGLSRPQQDFGQPAMCSSIDVRGVARTDGYCDAGAFEGGTP